MAGEIGLDGVRRYTRDCVRRLLCDGCRCGCLVVSDALGRQCHKLNDEMVLCNSSRWMKMTEADAEMEESIRSTAELEATVKGLRGVVWDTAKCAGKGGA